MKQIYSNQEESKLAAVLQFFCRSEIKKKKFSDEEGKKCTTVDFIQQT